MEVPPVLVPELVSVHGDAVRFTWDRRRLAHLPLEMCLRELMELDTFDKAGMLSLVERFGPVADPQWSLLPRGQASGWQPKRLATLNLDIATGRPSSANRRLVKQIRAEGMDARARETHDDVEAFTLSELQLHLTVLRDMVRLARALLPAAGVGARLGFDDAVSSWENPLCRPPKGEWLASIVLTEMLNPGLAPFHVSVSASPHQPSMRDVQEAREDWERRPLRERDSHPFHEELGAVRPGAALFSYPTTVNERPYAALCLQLSNLIAEGVPLRRCAAEGCPNVFVRKRDRRYTKGQHRLRGVRFCSDACEDRQKKRDSRRRRRETSAKETEGETP